MRVLVDRAGGKRARRRLPGQQLRCVRVPALRGCRSSRRCTAKAPVLSRPCAAPPDSSASRWGAGMPSLSPKIKMRTFFSSSSSISLIKKLQSSSAISASTSAWFRRPVFRGKRVQRQRLHADDRRRLRMIARRRLGTRAVGPRATFSLLLLRPAPVAVHDDPDMAGKAG